MFTGNREEEAINIAKESGILRKDYVPNPWSS